MLVDIVRRVTEGLSDDEQGGFRSWKGFVDHIFILEQLGQKAKENKHSVCRFCELGKPYYSFQGGL